MKKASVKPVPPVARYICIGVVILACVAIILAWLDQVGADRILEWLLSWR